jgi:hypothetical protein
MTDGDDDNWERRQTGTTTDGDDNGDGTKTTARTTDTTQHPHLRCEQLLAGWVGGSKDRDGTGTGTTNADTTTAGQPKTTRTSPNHHSEQLLVGWKQGATGTDNGETGPTTTTDDNGKRRQRRATHHPPPASRATAHGVDRGWNDGDDGRGEEGNANDDGGEVHNDELGRLQPPEFKVCFKLPPPLTNPPSKQTARQHPRPPL